MVMCLLQELRCFTKKFGSNEVLAQSHSEKIPKPHAKNPTLPDYNYLNVREFTAALIYNSLY